MDHYEVLEVVGCGGTGVVLRARDTKLLRVVALKVLAAPLAASGSARRRFAREARAAAAIRDDHVIAIHAVEDQGSVPYIVMEYIDGSSLDGLIRRNGPLEVKEILRIGIQVASGLAAAHKQGLIHRDIKPANILLENGVQRVKLTDFGLARAADDASLTQSGLIAGTPLYMAPEQASVKAIDFRADLFSLGSVLYELCIGRPAFRAPTTVAVIKRVCEETPRPIREVNADIPESVCKLIEQLHSKEPANRPASAREVADRLAELLVDTNQGRRELASSHRVTATLSRSGDHRWRWVAAAAMVLLVAGLSLGEVSGVTDVRGTVIRLFSPEGTLIVEVDDPTMSVRVDGEDLIITGGGTKEIRLQPGQYKVEASKEGRVVRQELVQVTQNGRRVLRITKEVEPTESDRWEQKVAELPAEKQLKVIERRLRELNPGFDGAIEQKTEEGKIVELKLSTSDVDDIAPIAALKSLRIFDCSGDLLSKSKLADLSPLRGSPIQELRCSDTRVADFSPLRGMSLTTLFAAETQVTDLAPLQGMPLTLIAMQFTKATSLTPLKGMPLTFLDIANGRGISDLSPLQDMPLDYLNISDQPVVDLSPIASLKSLRALVLDSTLANDLSPLRGLPIKELSILNIPAQDLSPLKELPLKKLRLDYRADREEFLRSFKDLETINEKPTAEFWKEVAGE